MWSARVLECEQMTNFKRPERSAAGYKNRTAAYAHMDHLTKTCVSTMVKSDVSRDDLIRIMFNDDAIAKLRAAHRFISAGNSSRFYPLSDVKPDVGLHLVFPSAYGLYAPGDDAREFHHDRADRLLATINTVYDIAVEWAVVRYVVWWLDGHATMGAIRYYFPAIATCNGFKEIGAMPMGRHVTPVGITPLLPLIRRASETLTKAALLPKDAVPNTLTLDTLNLRGGAHNVYVDGVSVLVPLSDYYI